jgi:hypothetical protein
MLRPRVSKTLAIAVGLVERLFVGATVEVSKVMAKSARSLLLRSNSTPATARWAVASPTR